MRLAFPLCLLGACLLGLTEGPGKVLVPLAWAAIILAQNRNWGAFLECGTLKYFGAISYPLYLVNEPVQRAVALLLKPWATDAGAVHRSVAAARFARADRRGDRAASRDFAVLVIAGSKERAAFCEKSGEKTFLMLGHGRCQHTAHGPTVSKVFSLLFFTKAVSFLNLVLSRAIVSCV